MGTCHVFQFHLYDRGKIIIISQLPNAWWNRTLGWKYQTGWAKLTLFFFVGVTMNTTRLVKMKNVQQKLCCKSHNDHKPRPEVKSIQKVWLKQNTSKPPMWGPHTRTLTASSCAIASAAICLLGQYVPWCWLYANSSFPMTTEKTREALKFTRICKRLELSSMAGKSWN